MTDERHLALVAESGEGLDLATAPITYKTLQAISRTEFVPKGLRGNVPAILACVMSGRELGLGPMESLQKIDVIDGRPSPSAELLVAMVFSAGHRILPVAITDTAATAKGIRADGTEFEFTFTMDDARRAGLANKTNWKNYPGPMLYWRAASQLCRIFFPDVLTSFRAYTPDELGDEEWIPPAPEMNVAEDGDDPFDSGPTSTDDQDTGSEVEADWTDDSEPTTSSSGLDTATEVVVEALDGEVVDFNAETAWSELLAALSLDPATGTRDEIEERTRNLCVLMESNDLWPDDSLHTLLRTWNKVEHWSSLGRKDDMIAFASRVHRKAEAKVRESLNDGASN